MVFVFPVLFHWLESPGQCCTEVVKGTSLPCGDLRERTFILSPLNMIGNSRFFVNSLYQVEGVPFYS